MEIKSLPKECFKNYDENFRERYILAKMYFEAKHNLIGDFLHNKDNEEELIKYFQKLK